MDMTRDALQYVVGLKTAEVLDINGGKYVDKVVHRVDKELRASAIQMNTLTSLVDYLKAGVDSMADKMLVQVVSPMKVRVLSMLDADRKREELVDVEARIPDFEYGRYMGNERLIIALQSKFIDNDDRALLLQFAGTVKDESIAQYGDDGVTQKATIKTGITSVGDAVVPNPVKLRPFRTFIEVEQPESAFVFRMRQAEGHGVECAIFEADGGAWKNAAMKSIKEYLQYELAELPQFTVIS
ncbi:hypothetical protein [Enterocloster clostridioformis]|uniref:Phage protein n=1 Tax=Enterocloster clostridioformis TaxID=1531 RepID=A0A1I0GMH1_9FIRM|nr:hypothetical protein [Enterocloster clostridioformis]SET71432.1 hypothetical protein SAMN05216521_102047 [Enterocloster clostridioformis]SEW16921.1 hypothetical protein SAMN05216528_101294 [Enterocloster clostridioformis]